MTLKTQMAADVDAVILNTDEHAETVTYIGLSSSARSIKAVVDPEEDFGDVDHATGRWRERRRTAWINSDATLGVASPKHGDTVTVAGVDWKVHSGHPDNAGLTRLDLRRLEQAEATVGGYRGT